MAGGRHAEPAQERAFRRTRFGETPSLLLRSNDTTQKGGVDSSTPPLVL
jgi:hypothetical protein